MACTSLHCLGALPQPALSIKRPRLSRSKELQLGWTLPLYISRNNQARISLCQSGVNNNPPSGDTIPGISNAAHSKRRPHGESVRCQAAAEKSSEAHTLTLDPAPEAGLLKSSSLDLDRLFRSDPDFTALSPQEDPRLVGIKESKFDRGGLNGAGIVGLKPFFEGRVPEAFKEVYSEEEIAALSALQGSAHDVEKRMKVRISEHYLNLAKRSPALMNLVKARPEETDDLTSGEADPSNQNRYSPVPGLLHKYEMVLLYASGTCSTHCRYCYRLDLFNGSTGKTLAQIDRVVDYIVNYNLRVLGGLAQPTIREALLSGGDPMILTNKRLARFLYRLADAGITTIRIGTKELAFFPMRFDANFFEMLDGFHAVYPRVRLVFMTHFTHPAEFLQTDAAGELLRSGSAALSSEPADFDFQSGCYTWLPSVAAPVRELLARRAFVSMENQTPVIRTVNDCPEILRTLQRELFARGLGNHYIFQCRDIPGKHRFAIPVETSWGLFTDSQKGLSGVEKHARFVMSTEQGKIEVVGVSGGRVVFRVLRCPTSASYSEGDVVICESRPEALWFSDCRDAVLFDPGRIFDNVL